MRLVPATILAVLVLVSASPAGAQSGSSELAEELRPATVEASTPPAAEATTERPALHEPLLLPKGRKPVLATGRAPDASVSWTPSVRSVVHLDAMMR